MEDLKAALEFAETRANNREVERTQKNIVLLTKLLEVTPDRNATQDLHKQVVTALQNLVTKL